MEYMQTSEDQSVEGLQCQSGVIPVSVADRIEEEFSDGGDNVFALL